MIGQARYYKTGKLMTRLKKHDRRETADKEWQFKQSITGQVRLNKAYYYIHEGAVTYRCSPNETIQAR